MACNETPRLSIFFFPFMAYGHMIPTLDIAKLFANKGAKTTIITTPLNLPTFSKAIQRCRNSGLDIETKIINFPASEESGLPKGCENVDHIVLNTEIIPGEYIPKFFRATAFLRQQLEELLEESKPDCLVADMFFPWATESAAKFNVPRIVFHGVSSFALCASESVRLYEARNKMSSSDSEVFIVPDLPGGIEFRRSLIQESAGEVETMFQKLHAAITESEEKSYGVLINSFYDLESVYADYYRNVKGRKAWIIGPVSLSNRGIEEKSERGKESSINEHDCIKWLDSKKPNSVIYISFGSVTNFTDAQLMEIATGLEASNQDFIWVVRKNKPKTEDETEEWLPQGFEKRMEKKGLIIRGWAPQVVILEHESTGAFLTHCGWNSSLEGISAGLPMVTWPIMADQIYNEKLLTHCLKIGVSVGVQKMVKVFGDFITRDKIEKAVRDVVAGPEAEERRQRAKRFSELARKAVENGGSSVADLNDLIAALSLRKI